MPNGSRGMEPTSSPPVTTPACAHMRRRAAGRTSDPRVVAIPKVYVAMPKLIIL
jgi:hypothetical protein